MQLKTKHHEHIERKTFELRRLGKTDVRLK